MIKFLKKWLKTEASFFLWTYIPTIIVIIFSMLMAHYFPAIAIPAIGIFLVIVMIVVFFLPR